MSASRLYSDWPSVRFGSIRLWNTATGWAQLNSSLGSYDWSVLDLWLDEANAHGLDVIYTFGRTPPWASSRPADSACLYAPGECDPPNDLKLVGTGTNQHWKDFVTALATHAAGRIKYWELWNEPQSSGYWRGSFAQMVRLAQNARSIILSIDPNAVLLSPGTGLQQKAVDWTTNYLAAGGGAYVDIIAAHGYVNGTCPNTSPDPSVIPQRVSSFRKMLKTYGQAAKPLWITEASWGNSTATCFTNQDAQVAFVAQSHLFYLQAHVQRLYWYASDSGMRGTLWNKTILAPGIAYGQVENWLASASFGGCSLAKTIWQCTLTRSGGYQALAVWDASQTCTSSGCTTSSFTYPSQYTTYRDLSGGSGQLTGTTVKVGLKPILLEN